MIHSMGGGVIREYDKLIYCFVETDGEKRWYISPFAGISVGAEVLVPYSGAVVRGKVTRVETVTAQTAPYPVKHTEEILNIL